MSSFHFVSIVFMFIEWSFNDTKVETSFNLLQVFQYKENAQITINFDTKKNIYIYILMSQ